MIYDRGIYGNAKCSPESTGQSGSQVIISEAISFLLPTEDSGRIRLLNILKAARGPRTL